MTKFLVIFCAIVALGAASSCTDTTLLKAAYEFSEASIAMTSSKAYSDLKYCTSLKSAACCTDTDINNIGAISDSFTKNLTTLVSTRDTYIKTVKDSVLPTLLTNVQNFNKVAATFIANFEKQLESAMSSVSLSDIDESELDGISMSDMDESDLADSMGSLAILSMVGSFEYISNITTAFAANVDSIKSNYGNYQNARRTCVLEMIDLQNSAMCLACDPNAGSKGFVDFSGLSGLGGLDLSDLDLSDLDLSDLDLSDLDLSEFDESEFDESEMEGDDDDESDDGEWDTVLPFAIAMSTATCTRLQNSCKPYLALAVGQNQLIEVAAAAGVFSGLTTAMQSFNDGKYDDAMTQIATVMETESKDATEPIAALQIGGLPTGCNTNGECEFICSGLFVSGFVNPYALTIGGIYGTAFDEEEAAAEEGLERRRVLAEKRKLDSGWAPAEGESGVTVNFAADPANTNTAKKFGSLSFGNVFVGMMVMISSILLF